MGTESTLHKDAGVVLACLVDSSDIGGGQTDSQFEKRLLRMRSLHLLTAFAVGVFSMLIFLPPVLAESTYGEDYRDHIQFAADLLRTGHLVTPHFLFHVLLNAMAGVLGSVPVAYLAATIGVLSYGVLG